MRRTAGEALLLWLLRLAPVLVFLVVILVFASLSDRFLEVRNFTNILNQSAHVAILGIGITFVLLTGGIDLSVGSIMYLAVAVMTVFAPAAAPIEAFLLCCLVGLAVGALNGFLIVPVRIVAFIATLSMLFVARGVALYLTDTRMMMISPDILMLARTSYLGVSWAIWVMAGVFLIAWLTLRMTAFGRHLYAIGENRDAAMKVGINVPACLFAVYVICGLCAGIAGFVSGTQVGAASSTFGLEKEFAAIAAAVIGGTSLFGGRGGVVGTVFGAVLIQTVYTGLVIINADPYIYPLITASIIFLAVLVDTQRARLLANINRRMIRPA